MRFVKGSFLIQSHTREADVYDFSIREGWLDTNRQFGFYKHPKIRNRWIATDLSTGAWICYYPTRRECAEWVESHLDEIREGRVNELMIAAAERMREYCAGARQEE